MQIKMHKDKHIDSKYVMGVAFPLALASGTMIGIGLGLFLVLLSEVGYAVYINEEYDKLTKELVEIMEDEKHEKLESRRNLQD